MPTKKAKRADGRYTAYISLGYDENGKRLRKAFYGATQREALEKKEAYLKSVQQNVLTENVTVSEWAEKWLSAYASGGYSMQKIH